MVLSFLAIYALSLLAGVVEHTRYEQARVAAQKGVREAWLNQGQKNPHAATYFGTAVFPRRSALSILEPGTLPYLGVAAYLKAERQTEFIDLPARDASPLAGLVSLSPAFCWQVLFPFLVVLLTYSALARDRETGMERYLMAVGANRATLVFGKTFGVGLVLLAVFLSAFGLGGAVASLVGRFWRRRYDGLDVTGTLLFAIQRYHVLPGLGDFGIGIYLPQVSNWRVGGLVTALRGDAAVGGGLWESLHGVSFSRGDAAHYRVGCRERLRGTSAARGSVRGYAQHALYRA